MARWETAMIDSTGPRMINFNYLVTLTYVVDLVMTGLMMANFEIF